MNAPELSPGNFSFLYVVSLIWTCGFKSPLYAIESRKCICSLNSRLLYPTAGSVSPFKCQIGTSNFSCPKYDLEFPLPNLLLPASSSSLIGSSTFPVATDKFLGDITDSTLLFILNFSSVSESCRLCLQNIEREYKFFSSPPPLPLDQTRWEATGRLRAEKWQQDLGLKGPLAVLTMNCRMSMAKTEPIRGLFQ